MGAEMIRKPHDADDTSVDLVIVRENTQDVYVKEEKTYELEDGTIVAEAIKRIDSKASSRIARMAGEIALKRKAIRETSGDNVGKQTMVVSTGTQG